MIFRKSGKNNGKVMLQVQRVISNGFRTIGANQIDPQLERVITAWDHLPANIRQAILMMIEI